MKCGGAYCCLASAQVRQLASQAVEEVGAAACFLANGTGSAGKESSRGRFVCYDIAGAACRQPLQFRDVPRLYGFAVYAVK